MEYRESNKEYNEKELRLEQELDITCDNFILQNPLEYVGVANGNSSNDKKKLGRPETKEKNSRYGGLLLRNKIRDKLHQNLLFRPSGNLGIVVQRDRYNRQRQWEHQDVLN